jgi:NhaP-type Na+/H+ or K+/H+ antiporter
MGATALLAHYAAGVSWLNAWLIGAVLSPTDPVFAAAIVGRSGVSQRLRHLLNVESGFNDGLALPIVLGLLALGGAAEGRVVMNIVELVAGVVIGIVVPWVALRFERTRFFAIARSHEPFFPFAIGIVVFAFAELVHANQFLAAFTAGVTMATLRRDQAREVDAFGEQFAELLKLAALLVFGGLISPAFLREVPLEGYAFGLLALFVARPAAIALALWGARLEWRNKVAAMWFGPKGFASVIYGLMVLGSGLEGANESFHLIAIVIVGSILAHSSTDVVMARWLKCTPKAGDALAAGSVQP